MYRTKGRAMSDRLLYFPKNKVLTTAEILYHLPDYPELLQSFIWQKLDLLPKLPELHKFLSYWTTNLDGKLHSVRVATFSAYQPVEFTFAASEFTH